MERPQWISGFTGSAGTVVITHSENGLWTDGRYHIQAEKQLQGSGITLFKQGLPNVPYFPEWLADTLPENSVVGLYGEVFSRSQLKNLKEKLEVKNISINTEHDLLNDIWEDRPAIPQDPLILHDVKFAGKSASEKLAIVREEMQKKRVNYHLISSLDDIAWLYNIRGNDVAFTPVAYAYTLISSDKAWLFIHRNKLTPEVRENLESQNVIINDYEAVFDVLSQLNENDSILIDPNIISVRLDSAIPEGCKRVEDRNLTTPLKAVKNETEISHVVESHIQDGVAMVNFFYWLEQNLGKERISEITVSEKLEYFRRQRPNNAGPSFATICGYKEHAAMMHYFATAESDYELEKAEMLLLDSGGQYYGGTTDITRTIVLGPITEEQRLHFTLVVKAHIGLARAKFLHGATGSNLDVLARQPIWEHGLDYKCGTGHGIGYFLSVHEGPQNFSQSPSNVKLEKGMIITNEPGIYLEGRYGIRIENEMLVVEDSETEFGKFMRFEPVTFCPIDLNGIDPNLLTLEEKAWLNDYHKLVFEKLSPHLEEAQREWLKHATREI